jgi:hypothetical protein
MQQREKRNTWCSFSMSGLNEGRDTHENTVPSPAKANDIVRYVATDELAESDPEA